LHNTTWRVAGLDAATRSQTEMTPHNAITGILHQLNRARRKSCSFFLHVNRGSSWFHSAYSANYLYTKWPQNLPLNDRAVMQLTKRNINKLIQCHQQWNNLLLPTCLKVRCDIQLNDCVPRHNHSGHYTNHTLLTDTSCVCSRFILRRTSCYFRITALDSCCSL
jgi:hypothetical protein